MSRDAEPLLTDAGACAAVIEGYTAGLDFEAYCADMRTQDAVERRLITIGEALARLSEASPDLAGRIPELRKAVGLRNRLTHVYHQIDHAVVWETAVNDIPELRRKVRALLSELSPPVLPKQEKSGKPGGDDLLDWQRPPSPFDI